jgi:hypothetical protein
MSMDWVEVQIHVLTSALVGGEWLASRPGRFTPEERSPDTHWIGGLMGPRAGLDDTEKGKVLTVPGLELQPLGVPVSIPTELSRRHHTLVIVKLRSIGHCV